MSKSVDPSLGFDPDAPPKRNRRPAPTPPPTPAARLVPCEDCGHMVSRRASACPHCGAPVDAVVTWSDARSRVWREAGYVTFVLVAIALILRVDWVWSIARSILGDGVAMPSIAPLLVVFVMLVIMHQSFVRRSRR